MYAVRIGCRQREHIVLKKNGKARRGIQANENSLKYNRQRLIAILPLCLLRNLANASNEPDVLTIKSRIRYTSKGTVPFSALSSSAPDSSPVFDSLICLIRDERAGRDGKEEALL